MFHIGSNHILAALAAAALTVLPSQASHAAYPEQLIKVIVTFPPGGSADIVIRALEPRAGLGLMQARRGLTDTRKLCSGPGKLAQAFAITGADHGRDLCGGDEIGFEPRAGARVVAVGSALSDPEQVELLAEFS